MCRVSILLPVYNVRDYVAETIESVLSQTYSDFELIIIDDLSSDDSVSIIESYCKKDDRVHLYKNKRNLGISKALNYGLTKASGKYIARIDGDDLMAAERLDRQLKFLESHLDYGLVGCWVNNIDENGLLINKCEYPVTHEQALKCLTICSPVLHIWMARADLYESLGGYRDTNPAEDYDLLLRTVDLGFKIGNLPYYDADIRLRDGNTMSVAALKQRKSFNFLRQLYLAGQINAQQTLDLSSEKNLHNSKFVTMLHNFSVSCLKRAFSSRNIILKSFFALFSLVSPYTVQDIYRRTKFKKIISNLKNKETSK